jgi:hypothetical protein
MTYRGVPTWRTTTRMRRFTKSAEDPYTGTLVGYLTEAQAARIRAEADQTGTVPTVVLRRAIDGWLAAGTPVPRTEPAERTPVKVFLRTTAVQARLVQRAAKRSGQDQDLRPGAVSTAIRRAVAHHFAG